MTDQRLSAPLESGTPSLGYTLPSLLDTACAQHPNPKAFNQFLGSQWSSCSNLEFRRQAEELAVGLRELGLWRGDRVCLYMHNDTLFGVVDMACLLAGLVNVPLYLTHADELIAFVLKHSEAKLLCVSDTKLLAEVMPLLPEASNIQHVVVAASIDTADRKELQALNQEVVIYSLPEVRRMGAKRLEHHSDALGKLREQLHPDDLATIIYTSGTTGEPKGVMLSHQNISSNALDAFKALPDLKWGPQEVTLSFLPLTHIFQRMIQYGHMYYGHSIYYTTPDSLPTHLQEVRPTLFVTVPRLIEKVYEKIQARGEELTGFKRRLFDWAMARARQHQPGGSTAAWQNLLHLLADLTVYSRWRSALGKRTKYIISGGAALRPELARIFDAAGMPVLQGYGLTETSPVVAFTRPWDNRPGTVGVPIAGVEVRIDSDGEILTRGPHVMKGYYKRPEETEQAIDKKGWLHTGDLGCIKDGHLTITGRKKALFKLSTGKFVMPQPLERALEANALIEKAVIVGEGKKFCAALLFPNVENLTAFVQQKELKSSLPLRELVKHPVVQQQFQYLVDQANAHMPPWSTVKQFAIIPDELTAENQLLTPTLKVRRLQVQTVYANVIERMYQVTLEEDPQEDDILSSPTYSEGAADLS